MGELYNFERKNGRPIILTDPDKKVLNPAHKGIRGCKSDKYKVKTVVLMQAVSYI